MPELILTLAVAVAMMIPATINAQTEHSWDFTQDLSTNDKTNIEAEVAKTEDAAWENYNSKKADDPRYRNTSEISNAGLTANSQDIELTAGLTFSVAAKGVRILPSKSIQMMTGDKVTISGLTKNQIVTVSTKSSDKNESRFSADNLTVISGFELSAAKNASVGTVVADGDVTLTIEGTENKYMDVYTITVTNPANITIGESGYATFSSDKAYKIPSGLTAYVTDRINSADDLANGVTFKSVGCLLAYSEKGKATNYEAYLIKGELGVYFLEEATKNEAEADSIANADLYKYNALRGNLKEATLTQGSNTTYFILGYQNGQVGFYKSTGEGKLAAGKAYLCINNNYLTTETTAKGLMLNLDGSATGINEVKSEGGKVKNHILYNLAGQRVGNDYKGVVICNGRKFLQK